MNPNPPASPPRPDRPPMTPRPAAVAALLWLAANAAADQPLTGFARPVRRVDVAAREAGTLVELSVRKGEAVDAGRTLGRLDDSVLAARLEQARSLASATARGDAAAIRLRRAERTRERLETLYREGHGGAEEIDEADADVAIARTEVRAAEEDARAAALEVRRIEAELRLRRVTAPFAGTVADLLKEEGEFVAASDPAVLTLVDLSQIRVSFFVPAARSEGLAAGEPARVRTAHDGRAHPAIVEFVAPLIDADSDTVRVDVLVDNEPARVRAGRRCELVLPGDPVAARVPAPNGALR